MSYSIIISATAKQHLQDSFDWYQSQRLSLGHEFRQEFKVAINRLSTGVVDYQVYMGTIRKTSLHRFPYYVYYERDEIQHTIVILAVLHFKRNPNDIQNLLP